jgi:hypothetical protein
VESSECWLEKRKGKPSDRMGMRVRSGKCWHFGGHVGDDLSQVFAIANALAPSSSTREPAGNLGELGLAAHRRFRF